ncbi:MAG: 16S rRNA (uracil(1498)-N(3))-methyltransferase [Wenzhouxiangellaceae bacterium]|nr:16S rRNA (uracil(1498)-N(3))-methyltransferase [Wenzhouxiangellaceae bacterium]
MRQIRIYTPGPLESGSVIELDARATGHVVRVLRLRPGDSIELFDGHGKQASAELVEADRRAGCRVKILQWSDPAPESPLRITLIQALARGDKMDWIVQKSVELGVAAIQPITSARCEVRLDERRIESRMRRWTEIMIGACEQSGRAWLPRLQAPVELKNLDPEPACRLFLQPQSEATIAGLELKPTSLALGLAIGPEGGWNETDLAQLQAAGFKGIRLGPRVLRTESAGIAAIAALQVLFGDMG